MTFVSDPQGKLKPAEEVLPEAKGSTDDQSNDHEHHMPISYI